MKIGFKNVSSLKLKLLFCVLMFLFGLYIVISYLIIEIQPLEYQTIYGNYHSYRKKTVVAGISTYTTNKYITVKIPNKGEVEYKINSISLPEFDEQSFLRDVDVDDPVELIIEDDYIMAIRVNGKSYLDLEGSFQKQKNNEFLGYCFGGICMLVSCMIFSTLITVKKNRRSKGHKR